MRAVLAALPLAFAAATAMATPAATAAAQAPAAAPASTGTAADVITEVRLRDGTVLYGRIVREDAAQVTFRTTVGAEIQLTREQIASIRDTAGQVVNGQFWPEDPNTTRLLFTSTGRPLAKGEGYVSAYFLFLPFVGYGVTDRFTVAAGTPIIPGAIGKVFYVAPKYTIVDRAASQLAVGALSFATTESWGNEGTVGIAYGVGTFGNRNTALTLGAGWGYKWGGGDADVARSPVAVIGGELRGSRRVKLLTENWVFNGGAIVSGGVRFLGDRLAADLGLLGMVSTGTGCCVPTVNFMWNFGRERRTAR